MALDRQGQGLRTCPTTPEESLYGQARPDHLPPRGQGWTQALAWWVLRRNGWDVRGRYPDASRLILIAAPHSSSFDWFWGMFVQWALGVRFSFLIKSAFFVPPLGVFMRWLGGIPVNRRRVRGLVPQAAAQFDGGQPCVLLLTPEGRTKPVSRLKRGFYEIASTAQVPVFAISFRYDERVIGLDGYVDLSGGFSAVEQRLKAHYGNMRGRHRGYLDDRSRWAVRPFDPRVKNYD